jgi:hypothetical protein
MEAMARFLLANVEWLRHHQAGHDAVEELTGDMRTARRVIDVPANRTTFPVGPCPEQFTIVATMVTPAASATKLAYRQDGMHCPGEVRAYIPNDETTPARLQCSACGTVWESWQWLRAGRRIKDREATMKGTAV